LAAKKRWDIFPREFDGYQLFPGGVFADGGMRRGRASDEYRSRETAVKPHGDEADDEGGKDFFKKTN
jgi:hypothetical protein